MKSGQDLLDSGHYSSDTIQSRMISIQNKWTNLEDVAGYRKKKIEENQKLQQFISDYNDIMSWLDMMERIVANDDLGYDEASSDTLLKKHKVSFILNSYWLFQEHTFVLDLFHVFSWLSPALIRSPLSKCSTVQICHFAFLAKSHVVSIPFSVTWLYTLCGQYFYDFGRFQVLFFFSSGILNLSWLYLTVRVNTSHLSLKKGKLKHWKKNLDSKDWIWSWL